jgi:hypothetical protein
MHDIGRQHLAAPYGNICNGCVNSETMSIMLTPTDALRDTNVRNNNLNGEDLGMPSRNTIWDCKADYSDTKLHTSITERQKTTSNIIVSGVGHLWLKCILMKQSVPLWRNRTPWHNTWHQD